MFYYKARVQLGIIETIDFDSRSIKTVSLLPQPQIIEHTVTWTYLVIESSYSSSLLAICDSGAVEDQNRRLSLKRMKSEKSMKIISKKMHGPCSFVKPTRRNLVLQMGPKTVPPPLVPPFLALHAALK